MVVWEKSPICLLPSLKPLGLNPTNTDQSTLQRKSFTILRLDLFVILILSYVTHALLHYLTDRFLVCMFIIQKDIYNNATVFNRCICGINRTRIAYIQVLCALFRNNVTHKMQKLLKVQLHSKASFIHLSGGRSKMTLIEKGAQSKLYSSKMQNLWLQKFNAAIIQF